MCPHLARPNYTNAAAAWARAEHEGHEYFGIAETLLIMMQQHNMKEENILYPMCDQHLAEEAEELVQQLGVELAAAGKLSTQRPTASSMPAAWSRQNRSC